MTFCWRKDYQTLISLKDLSPRVTMCKKTYFYMVASEIFSGSPFEEIFLNE